MATDTIEFEAAPGLTLTFDVYPEGSDTASFSGVTATERTNGKGTYRGTVTAPTAGAYKVHVKVGTDVIAVYWVRLANDGADHYCGDRDSWDALPKAASDATGGVRDVARVAGTSQTAGDLAALIDAVPTGVENADALLNRDLSTGTDSGSATVRTVRQALRFLRNRWAVSGGTLTVYKEDDSTASWTGTVSTDSAADPITGNDPASA